MPSAAPGPTLTTPPRKKMLQTCRQILPPTVSLPLTSPSHPLALTSCFIPFFAFACRKFRLSEAVHNFRHGKMQTETETETERDRQRDRHTESEREIILSPRFSAMPGRVAAAAVEHSATVPLAAGTGVPILSLRTNQLELNCNKDDFGVVECFHRKRDHGITDTMLKTERSQGDQA
eukprot:540507-Hanusia_phi.AAC.2